jgi:hypothetical protein
VEKKDKVTTIGNTNAVIDKTYIQQIIPTGSN